MIEQRDLFYIFLCVNGNILTLRDKWVNRYRKLMSMVKEGKLPGREKMTNLKKLEEENVKMLDSFGAAGDELRELRGKLTRLIGAESAGQNE